MVLFAARNCLPRGTTYTQFTHQILSPKGKGCIGYRMYWASILCSYRNLLSSISACWCDAATSKSGVDKRQMTFIWMPSPQMDLPWLALDLLQYTYTYSWSQLSTKSKSKLSKQLPKIKQVTCSGEAKGMVYVAFTNRSIQIPVTCKTHGWTSSANAVGLFELGASVQTNDDFVVIGLTQMSAMNCTFKAANVLLDCVILTMSCVILAYCWKQSKFLALGL